MNVSFTLAVILTGLVLIFAVVGVFYAQIKKLQKPAPPDIDGSPVFLPLKLDRDAKITNKEDGHHRLLHLPSPEYCTLVAKSGSQKKLDTKELWKQKGKHFKMFWGIKDQASKEEFITSIQKQIVHAVSSYIGGHDMNLFLSIIPELDVLLLVSQQKKRDGFINLITKVLEWREKVKEPTSTNYKDIKARLDKAADRRGETKNDIMVMKQFLSSFRKLCLYSFLFEVLDKFDTGVSSTHGKIGRQRMSRLESSIRSIISVAVSGIVMTAVMYSLKDAADLTGITQQQQQ